MAKTNVRGTQIADGSSGVDLTVDVFGVLPVANGGAEVSKNYVDQAAAGRPTYSYVTPVSGLTNSYSTERGIYNYKSSNTRNLDQGISNAMLASSLGGMTEWLWMGDSGSAGCNSSIGTVVYNRLLAVPLAARDALASMGVPAAGSGFIRYTDNGNTDARHVTTGTWTNTLATVNSTVVGSTITTTVDRYATQLDVWYFAQAASGTFTVSINGATTGAGFATLATAATPAAWKRLRMPGVTINPGSTVKITLTVAGTTGVYFSGISPFVPNGGLLVNNISQTGSWSGGAPGAPNKSWADYTATGLGSAYLPLAYNFRTVTDASFTTGVNTITSATAAFTQDDVGKPLDVLAAVGGRAVPGQTYIVSVTSGTVAVMNQNANQTMSAQTANIGRPPSAVHLELGLNDLVGGATVASVMTNLATIKAALPTQAQGTDIVLHLMGEVNYSSIPQATQQAYWQAMYNLADSWDCVLYDWRDRFGTYAQGQAVGAYGDTFAHPTPAVTADIGASLAVVIGGGRGLPHHADSPVRPEDLSNKRYVDGKIRSGGLLTQSITSNVETIVAQVFVPANSLVVGSSITYDLVTKPTIAGVTNARLRIGQAGTVAGDTAFAVAGTGISTTNTQLLRGVMSVLTAGATGTINGTGTFFAGTATNTPIGAPATAAIDTTKDNYLSLTAFVAASALTNYSAKLEVNV